MYDQKYIIVESDNFIGVGLLYITNMSITQRIRTIDALEEGFVILNVNLC